MLSHQQNPDSYNQPAYTKLPPVKEETDADLVRELPVFLGQFPEFARSKSKLQILQYCYKHYISVDPEFRQLSIQEKLTHAARMADNFFGMIIGARR